MITLIIFLIITAAEAVVVWFQVQRIRDLDGLGGVASQALGVNERYKGITAWVINKAGKFQTVIWIAIGLALLLNLLSASIISFIIGLFL